MIYSNQVQQAVWPSPGKPSPASSEISLNYLNLQNLKPRERHEQSGSPVYSKVLGTLPHYPVTGLDSLEEPFSLFTKARATVGIASTIVASPYCQCLAGFLLSRVESPATAQMKGAERFTHGRLKIDRIFTLNSKIQMRSEFQQPLWIAHVDLRAIFGSVDNKVI